MEESKERVIEAFEVGRQGGAEVFISRSWTCLCRGGRGNITFAMGLPLRRIFFFRFFDKIRLKYLSPCSRSGWVERFAELVFLGQTGKIHKVLDTRSLLYGILHVSQNLLHSESQVVSLPG